MRDFSESSSGLEPKTPSLPWTASGLPSVDPNRRNRFVPQLPALRRTRASPPFAAAAFHRLSVAYAVDRTPKRRMTSRAWSRLPTCRTARAPGSSARKSRRTMHCCRSHRRRARTGTGAVECLPDAHESALEVAVGPRQAEEFALPDAGEDRRGEERAELGAAASRSFGIALRSRIRISRLPTGGRSPARATRRT